MTGRRNRLSRPDTARIPLLVAFLLLIVTGVSSSSTVAPSILGNLLVVFAHGSFVVLAVTVGTKRLVAHSNQTVLILLISVLLFVNAIRNPNIPSLKDAQLLRVPAAILICVVNLYVVPRYVRPERAMWILALVSGGIVLFGVPSLVFGPHTIGWVEFAPYTDFHLPLIDETVPALTSFYSDSNAISKVALFGAFASMYLVAADRRRLLYWVLVFISLFGLYFGHSRSAILAFVAGTGVIAVSLFRTDLSRPMIAGGVFGAILGFGMLSGGLPAPGFIESIHLSSRGAAWDASFSAMLASPWLGYGLSEGNTLIKPFIIATERGLGPQNGFLYVMLATGFFGGVAYFLFLVRGLFLGAVRTKPTEIVLLGLCVAVFVLHFFEMVQFFGVNQSAMFASLSYGYLLQSGLESSPVEADRNNI